MAQPAAVGPEFAKALVDTLRYLNLTQAADALEEEADGKTPFPRVHAQPNPKPGSAAQRREASRASAVLDMVRHCVVVDCV